MRFWICLLLLLTHHLFSQNSENGTLVFHQLSIKDGLSEGSIRAIIEDKRGFMWFGTEDGLNKYDGYKFYVYRHNISDPYSLKGNSIKYFYNDSKGNLWIVTREGINLYDHVLDQFYNSNNDKYPALKYLKGDMESVYEDANGIIWVLSSSQGLFKLTDLYQKPELFTLTASQSHGYACMAADGKGNLYIGTFEGLLKFNTSTSKYEDLSGKYGSSYQIRDIYVAAQDQLWMATTEGLKFINLRSGNIKCFVHTPFKNSLIGNNTVRILPEKDHFMVAVDGKGLDMFDTQKEWFTHYSTETGTQLSSDNVISVYRDSKGTLWVGVFMNGINYSNITTNFFVYVKNNTPSHKSVGRGVVTNFLNDTKGNFWISTDGGGLNVNKKGTDKFINFTAETHPNVIQSDAVISLLEDSQHNVWATTYAGGLTRISPSGKTKIFRHDPQNSKSLIWDKVMALIEYNDQIWISSFGMGICVFDKKTETFKSYVYNIGHSGSIPSNSVSCFYKDHNGALWLGTFDGLAKYLPERDEFMTYKLNMDHNNADRNHVYDIVEDSEKHLWIGTNGGLVQHALGTEEFTTYTIKDGLSDNTVKSIIEDLDHNLWFATNNGITEFSIKTHKSTPYTLNEGLPAGSFFNTAKFRDGKGRIYFGMNEGYLIVDPALSVASNAFPKVVLTEFKIFNDPITPKSKDSPLSINITEAKGVQLSYDQNSLTFEFAGLNFSIPKHNFYAYKLEGFDKEWNYVGKSRMAKYTNLDPKRYVFKVKASNNEKVWDEYATRFDIYIAPPFWQTWWFRGLELVLIISLATTFYVVRTKSIIKANKRLKHQVSIRTKELQETNAALFQQTEMVLSQSTELLSQKQALEINNAKLEDYNKLQQKLIGIISHDLRGPITRFAALLRLIDEQTKDFIIEKLKENAATLSLLTSDLLSWAQMQSTKDIEVFDFTWQEVWDKASKELETFKEDKKVHFMVKHHATGRVKGIPAITQAAIRNIISNAIKYSEIGGIIEVESGVFINGYSSLRITDFGKGFDAEQINKLISGEGLKGMKSVTLQEGAGLGMSICYDMIKKCDGWIEAKSLEGSGGTFYIYLPQGLSNQPE